MKDATDLNREDGLLPKCDLNIVTWLTSIEALSRNSGFVSKESSHPLKKKDARTRFKREITRKLVNRRKRPPIDGWRLNDKEFDE